MIIIYKGRKSYENGKIQKISYRDHVDIEACEKKNIIKQKPKNEQMYKFERFSLRDDHFKSLLCKGKTNKSWLHGETIVAY